MMTDNWKEITDPEELFKLKREGWEIEVWTELHDWWSWWGNAWKADWKFRARPRQPKMKKVKLFGYLTTSGLLMQVTEDYASAGHWIRVPSEDEEIEVPE